MANWPCDVATRPEVASSVETSPVIPPHSWHRRAFLCRHSCCKSAHGDLENRPDRIARAGDERAALLIGEVGARIDAQAVVDGGGEVGGAGGVGGRVGGRAVGG